MVKLAIEGGAPVRDTDKKPWPVWPPHTEEEWARIQGEMRSIYFDSTEGLPGPRGHQFAKTFAEYLGTKYGLLAPHGSSALRVALPAVIDADGLGESGECLVPEYTFIASATTALESGFSVRFVDVEPETACMDPAALEAAITPRTKVILPVHILGCPADMDPIMAIAKKRGIKVVEDACQAHGASYKGKKVGSLGDAGCFSFQSTKNLTCGEGGFVSTDDADTYARAYALHNVGRAPSGMSFSEPRVGYNYRTSEYLAILLESRLKNLDAQTAERTKAVAYLCKELKGITGIRPAEVPAHVTTHAYHLFPMRYTPSAFGGKSRDEFISALSAEGIPCMAGYTEPLSRHAGMHAVKKRHPELIQAGPCPNTEKVCSQAVWIFQSILTASLSDLADIPEAIRKIQKAFHA